MGGRIIKLLMLGILATEVRIYVNGSFVSHDSQGKRGRVSSEIKMSADTQGVCNVGSSPATCRQLGQTYRGGGKQPSDQFRNGRDILVFIGESLHAHVIL